MYCVVNSITLLAPQINAEQLFSCIIRRIGQQLPIIMLEGMSTTELRKLALQPSVRFCIKHGVALGYAVCPPTTDLLAYWQIIQTHSAQHGAGSVIIGFGGGWNHWTCVRRMTERTMFLADSTAMPIHRVYRRHVTLGKTGKHSLRARDTFLITVSK